MQIGGGQFRKRIQPLPPGTKILVMPRLSYMAEGKNEKTQFLGQNSTVHSGPPLLKFKNIFKNVSYDQTCQAIDKK